MGKTLDKPCRRGRTGSVTGTAVLACVAALSAGVVPAVAADAPPNAGNLHGASPTQEQQTRAQQLLGKPTGTAPAGVAPLYWKVLVGADAPITAAQIALGEKLYFDRGLSADGTVACATCHDVNRGFTDQRATSEGIRDQVGRRNAPTTINAVFYTSQFWDGRAATLEEQAKLPILNPIEMGQPNEEAVLTYLKGDAAYTQAFQAAYGTAPSYKDLGRAIAAYESTLVFLDAPFDRFARGDASAISADAAAGWALFNGKARCNSCHQISSSNPIGSDNRFHNIGVSARHQDFEQLALKGLEVLRKDNSMEMIDKLALETDLSELGRFVVTRNRSDIGSFKTPGVRNVGVTGPYMHDGSLTTLWDVMDHYNKGGEANPYLDGGIEPLNLSEQEVNQVVAFLFSLTDSRLAQESAAAEKSQREVAAKQRPFRDEDLTTRKVLPFEKRLNGSK